MQMDEILEDGLEEKSICASGKETRANLSFVLASTSQPLIPVYERFGGYSSVVRRSIYEIVSQYKMRNLWTHRLLSSDPLPNMQMGLEERSSRQRDGTSEAGSASSRAALRV